MSSITYIPSPIRGGAPGGGRFADGENSLLRPPPCRRRELTAIELVDRSPPSGAPDARKPGTRASRINAAVIARLNDVLNYPATLEHGVDVAGKNATRATGPEFMLVKAYNARVSTRFECET